MKNMTDYLDYFFYNTEFPKEDADFLIDTYKTIANSDYSEEWASILCEYDKNINMDYKSAVKTAQEIGEKLGIHKYTIDLLFYSCLSRRLEQRYKEKGISEEIFFDTMRDLRYKLIECKIVKKICGMFVGFWFPEFFTMERFTLGRLTFETIKFNLNYEKDGKILTPESIVLNTHIPRTETPLTPEECDKSFAMAAEFFKDKIDGDIVFMCASWILYPTMLQYLSDNSNTKKFAKRFDIAKVHDNENGHPELWRLFDVEYNGDIDSLPADTSFRRAVIKMLKDGHKTGSAIGVFFY